MLPLGKNVIVFDGGFGSELERAGLSSHIPEELNVTHAEEVRKIHRSYSCADVITTNTFGLNRIKYRGKYFLKELALAAIKNARVAGKPVFFDVGPTGAMLQPLGTLPFDGAYDAYAEIAELTKDLVDGYIAETFSDLYEMKACLLALKEHTQKPVYATMTFDGTGRTLTGSTPEIVAMTLEGLGADALGVNCSLGPKELVPIVERLLRSSGVPVIVQPNRGLPVLENGATKYPLGADEFEAYAERFVKMGVSVPGGCCGTTPEFIERISKLSGRAVKRVRHTGETAVCSATRRVVFDGVKICGERLNPTGKKRLKEALLAGDFDYLADEGVRQEEAGADLIDLNVGVPKTDERAAMAAAVKKVQEYVSLPIQIDSSDADAIEAGARYYNGIPLINSVNGDERVMARIFPIAKKYGAVVLGLTVDGGVPQTARKRAEIAKRIVARAAEYGIPRHKVMIDTLVVTASAEQKLVKETLSALRLVKRLGVKTALGVSNVSFGLPARGLVNRTFLIMAMTCGLDMPILNPLDPDMMGAVRAHALLTGEDENAEAFVSLYRDAVFASPSVTAPVKSREEEKEVGGLYDCVVRGGKNRAAELCALELERRDPMSVINDVLIRALDEVGRRYDEGSLYLPQLVSAAETAKLAFAVVSEKIGKSGEEKGTVVVATVKGDVHDIGKNIVKVVLESYGYRVIDLGKDTPIEAVVAAYQTHKPLAIGLSALMTTTVKGMEETIAALRAVNCSCPIFVGGAVLNAELAKEIGADYYTKDALGFVRKLQEIT